MNGWKQWSPSVFAHNCRRNLPTLVRFVVSSSPSPSRSSRQQQQRLKCTPPVVDSLQQWAARHPPPALSAFVPVLVDVSSLRSGREVDFYYACVQFARYGLNLELPLGKISPAARADGERFDSDIPLDGCGEEPTVLPLCDVLLTPDGAPFGGWTVDLFSDGFSDRMVATMEDRWISARHSLLNETHVLVDTEIREVSSSETFFPCVEEHSIRSPLIMKNALTDHDRRSFLVSLLLVSPKCPPHLRALTRNAVPLAAVIDRLALPSTRRNVRTQHASVEQFLNCLEAAVRSLSGADEDAQSRLCVACSLCRGASVILRRHIEEGRVIVPRKCSPGQERNPVSGDGGSDQVDTFQRVVDLCNDVCERIINDDACREDLLSLTYAAGLSRVCLTVILREDQRLSSSNSSSTLLSDSPSDGSTADSQTAEQLSREWKQRTRKLDNCLRQLERQLVAARQSVESFVPARDTVSSDPCFFDVTADEFVQRVFALREGVVRLHSLKAYCDGRNAARDDHARSDETDMLGKVRAAMQSLPTILQVLSTWDVQNSRFRRQELLFRTSSREVAYVAASRGRGPLLALCDVPSFNSVWGPFDRVLIAHSDETDATGINKDPSIPSNARRRVPASSFGTPVQSDCKDTPEARKEDDDVDEDDRDLLNVEDDDGTPSASPSNPRVHDAAAPTEEASAGSSGEPNVDFDGMESRWGQQTRSGVQDKKGWEKQRREKPDVKRADSSVDAAFPLPWIPGIGSDHGNQLGRLVMAASVAQDLLHHPAITEALANVQSSNVEMLTFRKDVRHLVELLSWLITKRFGFIVSRTLWSPSSDPVTLASALPFVNASLLTRAHRRSKTHRLTVLRFYRVEPKSWARGEEERSPAYTMCCAHANLRHHPLPLFLGNCGTLSTLQALVSHQNGAGNAANRRSGHTMLYDLPCFQTHVVHTTTTRDANGASSTDSSRKSLRIKATLSTFSDLLVAVEQSLAEHPQASHADVIVRLQRKGLVAENVVLLDHLLALA